MNPDFPTLLIAAVFASQILVCSFISAWRAVSFSQLLREKYPPAEYPRLYPIPPEQMHRHHQLRMALRLVVGVAAVVVLAVGLARGIGAGPLANQMLWVAMAQLLPLLLFLPQQISITRALRAMPAPATRTADLRQWRVGDFVSPVFIALGIMAAVLSLACSAYFYLQDPSRNLRLHLLSAVISALLLGRMLHVLLTPLVMSRPDPYMSADDVFSARQLRLRMLYRGGFALGLYFAFMEMYAARQLRFEYFYLAAGLSILVQIMSLRMTHMAQNAIIGRNLSPYRAEPTK